MKHKILIAAIAAVVIYIAFFYRQADGVDNEVADLVINNTKIYTSNEDQWTAEAVAVKDDKIIFVGSNSDVSDFIGDSTKVLDMDGNTVFPGLIDAHVHIKWIGQRELGLNLQGIEELDETVAKIRERVESTPEGEWVVGVGWIENKWTDQRFLTKDDLDSFSPNTPVVANRAGEHSIVANSKAMELAGITRDTPDPIGGQILKDENGEPTGMFIDNAMDLIRRHIPEPTRAQDKRSIQAGFDFMSRMGWTQVQQAGGSYADIDIIKEIHSDGNLKTSIYYAMLMGEEGAKLIERGPEISVDRMIDIKGIKYFADGALGSRGAALLDPYHDAEGRGLQLIERDAAIEVYKAALRKGIQIETHAIGDYANRFVLDLYEVALNAVPPAERADPDPRWRIEHAQITHPDDQKRYKDLDIIAVVEASTVKGDMNFAPARLGSERLKYSYRWKSLIDQGIRFSAGTDAPVERGDPREEFFSLIQRTDFDGHYTEDWDIDERLPRDLALKTMTLWAAHAAFQEDVRGSIEVGKKADFSIFNKDWMTIDPFEIMNSETVMTIVDGKVSYSR